MHAMASLVADLEEILLLGSGGQHILQFKLLSVNTIPESFWYHYIH